MAQYKCMACNKEFETPYQNSYARHEKYGGCTWGIGVKLRRPTKRAVDLKPAAVVKVKRIVASNR
jgi:DNA-directed RNA polymerase subunit RPC12/RpoP